MKDTLEEVINISIGAIALIKDKFIKEVEAFIEEKDLPEKDREEFKKRLLERADKEKEYLRKLISERAEDRLEGMGFVRSEKLEKLKAEIEKLEERIKELENK